MKTNIPSRLSDTELVAEVSRLAHCERETTAHLIAHLAEFDARGLYLGLGFSSLFSYCTEILRLFEHEAYNRIEAARAARAFPLILDMLVEGSLNLTTVRLLAPHLRGDNHEDLLAAASCRRKCEVEELLGRRFPRPDVPSSVRRLPAVSLPSPPRGVLVSAVPPVASTVVVPPALPPPDVRQPAVRPLAPDRYAIRFTASAEACEELRLAQDLLRHAIPDGDPAEIF